MATAALFLGTGFLPAMLAPIIVVRAEQPPPRIALPVIYCGEAAAFLGLALLAGDNFSLIAVVALATIDGALALTGRAVTRAVAAAMLEPSGELRAGNAILNVAFTGGAALGPGIAGLVVAGFDVQTALLLDAASFYAIALILYTAGPLPQASPRPRPGLGALQGGPRLHPRAGAAAQAADRRGHPLRLLRRRDPDRGDLRQGDARRRRLRLRPAARQLGRRHGRRQLRLRRGAAAPASPTSSSSARSRSASATSAWRRRRPCCRLHRLDRRRRRQRGPVGGDGQRRAGADLAATCRRG